MTPVSPGGSTVALDYEIWGENRNRGHEKYGRTPKFRKMFVGGTPGSAGFSPAEPREELRGTQFGNHCHNVYQRSVIGENRDMLRIDEVVESLESVNHRQ